MSQDVLQRTFTVKEKIIINVLSYAHLNSMYKVPLLFALKKYPKLMTV